MPPWTLSPRSRRTSTRLIIRIPPPRLSGGAVSSTSVTRGERPGPDAGFQRVRASPFSAPRSARPGGLANEIRIIFGPWRRHRMIHFSSFSFGGSLLPSGRAFWSSAG